MHANTIVVSDFHLGSERSAETEIHAFFDDLKTHPPGRLILNGDIIEYWITGKEQAEASWQGFFNDCIAPLIEQGTRVTYVIGNADYNIHTEIVQAYEEDPESIPTIKERFAPGKGDLFEFAFPSLTLSYNEGTADEKQIFINHGDLVDYVSAFSAIGSIHLRDIKIVREDDILREIIHSISPHDVFDFYRWLHKYPHKYEIRAIETPFRKITTDIRVLQFLSYILSPLSNTLLRRMPVKRMVVPDLLLMVVPIYGSEFKKFIEEHFAIDFPRMAARLIRMLQNEVYHKLFGSPSWWEYYHHSQKTVTPDEITDIIIGHIHKQAEVITEGVHIVFNGGWHSGETEDIGSYVEIDETGTIRTGNFVTERLQRVDS